MKTQSVEKHWSGNPSLAWKCDEGEQIWKLPLNIVITPNKKIFQFLYVIYGLCINTYEFPVFAIKSLK